MKKKPKRRFPWWLCFLLIACNPLAGLLFYLWWHEEFGA